MPKLRRGWQGASQEEMIEYKNSQISEVIDEYIHNKRDRDILRRRLVDGIRYEQLAEEFDLSVRQVKNIVYKYGDRVLLKCQ